MPTSSRPLVIGIGNEFRGDDVAGLLAVRALAALGGHARADLLEHRGDGAGLLDAWSGRARVVLIDAMATSRAPGEVVYLDASERLPTHELGGASTHALGPAQAVEMARALGQLPARVELYAIAGRHFAMGDDVGAAVRAAADRVARAVLESL